MIRVGLSRTPPHYRGIEPPFGPGKAWPELAALQGGDGAPNHIYAGVRAALAGAGLDAAHAGGADWNPLGDLVPRGGTVVLKPNFIRHWNPCPGASIESVVTHGALLRACADYAFLAVGPEGRVVLAEAPQHDCDWARIRGIAGLDALVEWYEAQGLELELIDLRREAVRYQDGVIAERWALPGDPDGYRLVDLGAHSHFHASGLDPRRFRGADYDPGPTSSHHQGGRNEYLLSETVLRADLVVNLPKLKTHKKTGVTLALKNLVGINGDKNLLPHHCVGAADAGGDEFPGAALVDRARSSASEVARWLLSRGIGTGLVRVVRRAENRLRGESFPRSGNWHGNSTTWRMVLDLNRCFYYSDAAGARFDARAPVRRALHVLDGVVAGEGEGPLAPRDVPLGALLCSTDPVALDLAALRLMGYDERRLPKIREAMAAEELRVTVVRGAADVRVHEVDPTTLVQREQPVDALRCERPFAPHSGWRGHVERATT